ncbi:MAG: hypothetical protein ABH896_02095 [Candidatus Jacksonbacteria bacterium]
MPTNQSQQLNNQPTNANKTFNPKLAFAFLFILIIVVGGFFVYLNYSIKKFEIVNITPSNNEHGLNQLLSIEKCETSKYKQACYNDLAKQLGSVEICEDKITDEDLKRDCYLGVAKATLDDGICAKMGNMDFFCYSIIVQTQPAGKMAPALCKKIIDIANATLPTTENRAKLDLYSREIRDCYTSVAKATGELSYCKAIPPENDQNYCYERMAEFLKNDLSICNQISSDVRKNDCYLSLIKEQPDLCQTSEGKKIIACSKPININKIIKLQWVYPDEHKLEQLPDQMQKLFVLPIENKYAPLITDDTLYRPLIEEEVALETQEKAWLSWHTDELVVTNESGKNVWGKVFDKDKGMKISALDLNQDNFLDSPLVLTYFGDIYSFTSTGQNRWLFRIQNEETEQNADSRLIASFDQNSDGYRNEFLVLRGENLFVFDQDRNFIWGKSFSAIKQKIITLSIADINGDGIEQEIALLISDEHYLFLTVLDKKGEVIWESKIKNNDFGPLSNQSYIKNKILLIGFNQNNLNTHILLSLQSNEVISFDLQGNKIWEKVMRVDAWEPIDFNADGYLNELLIVSDDKVYVLDKDGEKLQEYVFLNTCCDSFKEDSIRKVKLENGETATYPRGCCSNERVQKVKVLDLDTDGITDDFIVVTAQDVVINNAGRLGYFYYVFAID